MAREIGQPHSSSAAGAASAPASPSAAPSVPLLSVRDIIKRFPGIVANDAISLDFHAGEIHVILGENGAGKSTLIGILAGMQQPDSGAILLDGRAVQIRTPRQALDLGIGTIFQHVLLVPSLSVLDNLMLGGPWWQKLARTAARRRFADLSALLGMTLDADARLDSLSLGEQQQVEIMRALWRDARVLILDEPTSMLTPQGVKDLAQVLKRLRDNNVAIILVTHKLAEAHELGDRITVLRQGKCIGSISPNEHSALGEAEMTDLVVAMMFGAPDRLAGDERAILLGRGETLDRVSISRTGMSRTGTPRLWVDGVSTAPGQGAHALRDISFEVWPGEIFGIAGVDGNGQKQLAGVLAGQLRSVGGRIAVDGRDVTLGDVPARRQAGISYVTDDRLGEGSVGSLPVALNLLLKDVGRAPFWRRGVADQSRIDAFARALVARHDIRTPSIWTPLAKLSGGNIQKVLLARELADGGVADARVIIFNKPTHGLDLHNARLAHDRMRASAAAGSSIVLLSSDLDELLTLSDRIAVLSRGRLVGIVDNGPGAAAIVGRLMTGSQAA